LYSIVPQFSIIFAKVQKCIFIILCLFPASILAQDASNMIIQKTAIKDTTKQTDLIDVAKRLFHITPPNVQVPQNKKVYFTVLPISSIAAGGEGQALFTSGTAGIYLGPQKTTHLSSATFAPYWNLRTRFGLPLRTSIWLANNTWNIQGDTRFLVYPQYTWGLGNNNNYNNKILVGDNYIRFYQTALKRIEPYLFVGAGYDLDYHSNIKTEDSSIALKQFVGYQYGTGRSSFAAGVSLDFLYDTRNNSINPLPGSYANVVLRVNPTFLGSNENWNSLYIDVRKYLPLNPANPDQQNTLAFWSYFWTVFNGDAPYLDLPSIGWDSYNRSGRGIEQNRYRGKSLFYLEGEYRRDITSNGFLGFVVFANATTLNGTGAPFISWHPAVGSGLRIKINKGSSTNFDIDYGFSEGYNALILNLGEAF
jgi:hypothetical protein